MGFWSKAKDVVRRIVRGKRVAPAPGVSPPTPDVPKRKGTGGGTPHSIDGLVDALYNLGVAAGDTHGTVALHDITNAIGQADTRVVLRNQLQSTRAWLRGNSEPGHTRWENRLQWMHDHAEGEISFDIDVFFYYHAKRPK